MNVTNKSWAAMLRREEKKKFMNIVNGMFAGSAGRPFIFDCAVRFKGEGEESSMTFCACDKVQYEQIATSYMDNYIFFYIMSPEEFEDLLGEGNDFTVTDIYDNTYECLHLDMDFSTL